MLIEQIRHYFAYLFLQHEFQPVVETHYDSFGNWLVVLASKEYKIRFTQDRGEIDIAVGPNQAFVNSDWETGPWFNLSLIVYFLTNTAQMLKPGHSKPGSMDEQLDRFSKIFSIYKDSIRDLMAADNFKESEQSLKLLEPQWRQQLWS
jgi:hypothetical protein